MKKEEFTKTYNLTEDQFYGKTKIDGNLDLRGLTNIPEGFNPTVGGDLDLRNVTSIPKGFNPIVGDGWYIYNLEGQTYSSNALEKLLSTVELRKKL